MFLWIFFQFLSLLLWFFPAFRALPKGADVSEGSVLCWGGVSLLGGRQHLSHPSADAPKLSLEACPSLPVKHESSALQQRFRLGFLPLAIKLHSHRITTCLRFLKPFVCISDSYFAGSKFWPWLSRPQILSNLAPEGPRTHNKGGDKNNIYSLVTTYYGPLTVLNILNAASP